MGHGSIYTLSIVSIFHLKDGQNFANFFKSFLAAEFMRHTLIPIIKMGREWTFLIPTISCVLGFLVRLEALLKRQKAGCKDL